MATRRNMKSRIRATVVGIGLLAGLLAGAPAASAATCGDVLVANTTLTSNLTCSGTAFVIDADGIVLDLNGFTLTGDGTGSGVEQTGARGGFAIRNGRIQNFEWGVRLTGTVGGPTFAIVEDLRIRNNTDAGIRLEGAREVIVQRVRVSGSGTPAFSTGEGLDIIGGISNRVFDSVFFNNLQNGVRLNMAAETIVIDNTMRDNAVAGIDYADAVDSFARGNRIVRNDVGLFLSNSSGHNVETNKIRKNATGVLVTNPPAGLSYLNNFTDNSFARNGTGMLFEDPGTFDTTIIANRINWNTGSGIVVVAGKVFIEDNRASRNGASGMALIGGSQEVVANRTVNNIDWGIFVGAGSTTSGSANFSNLNGAGNCNQPGLCFP